MKLLRLESNNQYTVDQYDSLAWINVYEDVDLKLVGGKIRHENVESAVAIVKTKSTLPAKPEILFGKPPQSFIVNEQGIQFEIRTTASHPGLFLDHQYTRKWLQDNSKDQSVLNLFSFTGSLGIAAAVGGASESFNIDLANQATLWAKANAQLNKLGASHQFIKGDVFDWTNRFKKKKKKFDIVISDPPSQSRSDLLHFSTEKHLDSLHEQCIELVAPKGIFITSINTENLGVDVLYASVKNTAKKLKRSITRYDVLTLPNGFDPNFRSMHGIRFYLK